MEDILITKILETESEAEKIILDSRVSASRLIEDYTASYNLEKKQIERKYDDIFIAKQEQIKKDLDEEFISKLSISKTEIEKLKDESVKNYDKALNILLLGADKNGNS